MRGDGVGVGDIIEVSDRARAWRHQAGDGDVWGAIGKHVGGILGGRGIDERDGQDQPSRDGIGIGDGARGRARTDGLDSDDSIGADGMRGDGVGVGDIIEVYEWTSKSRDFACVFIDGWRKIGNPEPSVVC